jgi:hypothetical protein
MAEWMNVQQNNPQYFVNQRTMITNATSNYNSGNGGFARSPTLLKALKRTLQEMLGSGRWYGTMPNTVPALPISAPGVGWGVWLHLFLAGSRGVLGKNWLLRGHFGDFAMKSSAGWHDSYTSCYFICADIKSK